MQISDIIELYGMACELLVEAVCPVCNNVYIAKETINFINEC